MLTVKIPQYDFGYDEQFTIYTDGRHLTVKDLTDFTAWLVVWDNQDSAEPWIMREINIADDPTTGIVYWYVSSDDTAQFGTYRAEIRLIQNHLEEQPDHSYITITDMVYTTMQFILQIIPSWQLKEV